MVSLSLGCRRVRWAALLGVLGLLAAAAGAPAQMPLARLTSVFPPGAQRGTMQQVVIQGADLDDATRLWFAEPRIAAVPRPGQALTWDVVVPEGVPVGPVDVRVAGRFGISNPRTFVVGDLPEQSVTATNVSAALALPLPLDVVLNGRMTASAALWFRFEAKAGQRVVFKIAGRELDSRLEPVLTLLDAARIEVDQSRRGWLAFVAPSEGTWYLRVHDITYRGGDEHSFRLVASHGPQVMFAWPQVLVGGRTNRVMLLGRHFEGGKPSPLRGADGFPWESIEVDIAAPDEVPAGTRPPGSRLAGAGQRGLWWRAESAAPGTGPLFFALASTTNLVVAPLERPALLDTVPPCEVWGSFASRGESGGVRFKARKGEVWWMEVFSERLGFSTDTSLVVQRETGGESGPQGTADVIDFQDLDGNFGTPGFGTQTRDAAGRFEAPEDGVYRVTVRDLFRLSPQQARYPYRLVIRAETPGFTLAAHPVMPPPADPNQRPSQPWVTLLRRGETLPVRVLAFRRDGFTGDIDLGAEGLPAGVVATGTRIYSGQNAGVLLLQASEDVATWSGTIRVTGRSKVGDREWMAEASAASAVWSVGDYNNELALSRWSDGFALGVSGVESAPVVVEAGDGKPLEVVENAKVTIPLKVLRRGEFAGEVKLKAYGHPELEKLGEVVVAGSATQAVLELPLAERKLPIGSHTFYLQALTPGKYRNQPEAVAAAEAELRAAEQTLAAVTAEEKPKAEAAKKAAEEKKKAAEERAKPRDVQVAVYSKPMTLRIQSAPKP